MTEFTSRRVPKVVWEHANRVAKELRSLGESLSFGDLGGMDVKLNIGSELMLEVYDVTGEIFDTWKIPLAD